VQGELDQPPNEIDVYVVDEVGKMECLSQVFVAAASRILDSPVPVLATIAAKGGGFITEVKARQDVESIAVTAVNRDRLPEGLARRISFR
jgi:nucleoside-triphosphatase